MKLIDLFVEIHMNYDHLFEYHDKKYDIIDLLLSNPNIDLEDVKDNPQLMFNFSALPCNPNFTFKYYKKYKSKWNLADNLFSSNPSVTSQDIIDNPLIR